MTNDLDELTLGDDGSFRVIVSAERPEGHDGDWWRLDPQARSLLMRKCACDWNHEIDARVAVNRLDDPGADMTPEETAQRFSEMASWIEGTIQFDMNLVRYYREHHGINVLLRSQWIDDAGGLPKQAYYDGIHQIADDEALIVEFPVPTQCAYWQILVADDRFATVDWVNRQSSLNDVQARVDGDGWFRGVVSKQDPGVPNWLDKADYPWGILQARFYRANQYPEATVTQVPVADVRKHLPAETPVISAAEPGHATCCRIQSPRRAPSSGGSGKRPARSHPPTRRPHRWRETGPSRTNLPGLVERFARLGQTRGDDREHRNRDMECGPPLWRSCRGGRGGRRAGGAGL